MSSHETTVKLLVGGYGGRVETLSFNPITYELITLSSTKLAGSAPTWITLNQDHSIAYILDEWADVGTNHSGKVFAFNISPNTTGELTLFSNTISSGTWPCHSTLFTRGDSTRLLISNYGGSIVTSIPISKKDGGLELDITKHQVISLVGTSPLGPNLNRNRQDRSHPHQVVIDPSESFVLVPDLGTDLIRIFSIDVDEEGEVELVGRKELNLKLREGSGPRHILFTRTPGKGELVMYVLNELSNSISVFGVSYTSSLPSSTPSSSSRTPQTLYSNISFTLLQCSISTLPPTPFPHQKDFSTWHASELILSPSNSAIFSTNRAEDHAPLESTKEGPNDLFFISKLSENGLLLASSSSTPSEERKSKLVDSTIRTPRHISLSPSRIRFEGERGGSLGIEEEIEEGRYLLVGGQDTDALVVFERESMKVVARLEGTGLRPAVVLWL